MVPPPNRGAALGAYSVFFDISLGLTGPVAGTVASRHGYAAAFLFGGLCTAIAAVVTFGLLLRSRRGPDGRAA